MDQLQVESHPLRDWQQELCNALKLPPNDREIIFVVDKKGNQSKSWFCKYYAQVYGDCMRLTPSCKVDMMYAIYSSLKTHSVYFIDIVRSKMDNDGNKLFPYELMDHLKVGQLMNSKYTSEMINFPVPHVVCFSNEAPNMNMLSGDRYMIITIN